MFGSLLLDIVFLLAGAMLAVVLFFKHRYRYWKKIGVPYLEPSFPYGNYMYAFSKAPTLAGETRGWYNQLKKKGHKFGGVWMFARPILILVDPDYIKDVLTKDFHHFIERDMYVNEKGDPQGTHLFNIDSSGWKPLRQKLTPTFTSGKMKMMLSSVVKCSNPMVEFLEKSAKMGDDIQMREVVSSFTTDVIFSIAFGVESNSFVGPDTEFRKQGRELFKLTVPFIFQVLLSRSFPDLSRKLGVKSGKEGTKQFFAEVVKHSINYRAKNNITRPDFLQLLIDMNKETQGQEKVFTFDEIVANTLLFFIAGFDTSSSAMSFALYELARYPEIQEKTRVEINNVLAKYNGNITYEAVKEMTYLTQVIDETLRLWPALVSLARICTKDYKLRDTDIVIEKGTAVGISLLGLGSDPEIFPNPEIFDPDRFTPENKAKRHPYVHIPFGEGPRNCIGLRFGEMQSKIGLIRILTNFRLSISPKTQMPLTPDPRRFLLKSNETLYLKAEKIA